MSALEPVRQAVRAVTGDLPYAADRFEALGVDSLDMARIVTQVEDETGVDLSDRQVRWQAVSTVRDLAALFEEES